MTTQVKAQIKTDFEVGIQPRQSSAAIIARNPDSAIRPRDIANERDRVRKASLNGNSPMNFLLKELSKPDYIHAFKLDEDKHVTHLFFAYREVVDIFKANPDVILMDCTYKTNVFGIPLLNIVGVSGMNTTVHLAQCFMVKEEFEDYERALQQLRSLLETNGVELPQIFMTDRELALASSLEKVFLDTPFLLCLWHIRSKVRDHARKNALKPVKRVNPSDDIECEQEKEGLQRFCDAFEDVLRAPTEELYEARKKRLAELSPSEAEYIDRTWLDVWDRRMIRCWTNSITHFGMQASSRVEGYHASLKHWILDSNGDLTKVYNVMTHWWRQSIREDKAQVSDEQMGDIVALNNVPLFRGVMKKVHKFPLMQCFNIFGKLPEGPTPIDGCTGVFQRTMGLPCRHTLQQLRDQAQMLSKFHFHVHWWIERSEPAPIPEVVERDKIAARRAKAKKKRRLGKSHKKGNGARSTRRERSSFEVGGTPPGERQYQHETGTLERKSRNRASALQVEQRSAPCIRAAGPMAMEIAFNRQEDCFVTQQNPVFHAADLPPTARPARQPCYADTSRSNPTTSLHTSDRHIADPTNQWWLSPQQ